MSTAGPAGRATVIVLASGRGERFRASGGRTHKLQAMLDGMPVLERTLQAVHASGLPWHLEDASHPGMGDSIAAAVRATLSADGWLVLPADLPLIAASTLRAVADALAFAGSAADAVVPLVRGVQAHPVGFSASAGTLLAALRGDTGARQVLARLRAAARVVELPIDDIGAVTDIDTVADLERATALLRSGPPAPGGR